MDIPGIAVGAGLSWLMGSGEREEARDRNRKAKLGDEKSRYQREQRMARATGQLNLGKRGFEVGEKRASEAEKDRDYQAGSAGRIAQSIYESSRAPFAADRTAQFSAAGRVPETYDSLSGGTQWENALAEAQRQNLATADTRAGRMGEIVGGADLRLQDQERAMGMQRTMAEEAARGDAKDKELQEQQRRLALENQRLQFKSSLEAAELDRAYDPYLGSDVYQYSGLAPVAAAIGQGLYEQYRADRDPSRYLPAAARTTAAMGTGVHSGLSYPGAGYGSGFKVPTYGSYSPYGMTATGLGVG